MLTVETNFMERLLQLQTFSGADCTLCQAVSWLCQSWNDIHLQGWKSWRILTFDSLRDLDIAVEDVCNRKKTFYEIGLLSEPRTCLLSQAAWPTVKSFSRTSFIFWGIVYLKSSATFSCYLGRFTIESQLRSVIVVYCYAPPGQAPWPPIPSLRQAVIDGWGSESQHGPAAG